MSTTTGLDDGCLVQINHHDYYLAPPGAFDRSKPAVSSKEEDSVANLNYYHVPVIRVFGSLPTGHTVLTHIHGVFPYFYVKYNGVEALKFHSMLEKAVANSLKRGNKEEQNDQAELTELKYIAHVSLCKGVPFYGFHVGYDLFYKIYLLNPSYQNRIADLLRDGKVNDVRYKVYETHIPYLLQFLADYNLFGCAWLKLSNPYLRIPVIINEEDKTDELSDYLAGYKPTDIERVGFCSLEFDASAQDIKNRLEISERNLHHDFIEKFNISPSSQIYVNSTKNLWRDGSYQREINGASSYSPPAPFERDPKVKWIEDDENMELFERDKLINSGEFKPPSEKNMNLTNYQTAFESVTELFFEPQFDIPSSNGLQENDEDEDDYEETDLDTDVDDQPSQELIDKPNEKTPDIFEIFEEDLEEFEEEPTEDNINTPMKNIDDSILENDPEVSDLFLTQKLKTKSTQKRLHSTFESQSTPNKKPFRILTGARSDSNLYLYKKKIPKILDFASVGLPEIDYPDPYYIGEPPKPFIYSGKKFILKSKSLEYLDPIEIDNVKQDVSKDLIYDNIEEPKLFKYIKKPPTYKQVEEFNYDKPTSKSQFNITQKFKFLTPKINERRPDGTNNLRLMICETFSCTRDAFEPHPLHDEVRAIFWKFVNGSFIQDGLFLLDVNQAIPYNNITFFDDELGMLKAFAGLVRGFDPDIVSGYEVHSASWGYLIDRSKLVYSFDFLAELSRVSFKSHNKFGDQWGYTHTSAIKICGRHVLNIWRPLRSLSLTKYTLENVAFHLLHERVAHLTFKSLTLLFNNDLISLLKYFNKRIEIDYRLIETQDLISNAAEEARLIGIDFYDVFYRGSQYKVESFMIRIAKSENFILESASKKQVRKQKPLECIPLVMEPISTFYKSPLVVLDFQSLYPSIIIAYNYCYSTLLGRLRNYSSNENAIGVSSIKHPPNLLNYLSDDITLSPNGLMFVKSNVRKSLLAKMLEELLDTRVMVKSTMKILDDSMKKLYNSRQLALKLIANVTYGYTSASMSGRMPCSDLADCIVQTARETLEQSIEFIESNNEWGAKVVYGDTDSLFVYLPGRSKEDAFIIGKEMAEAVTRNNPDPVTLKFEKVYHPSILLAKKRYVGMSSEAVDSEVKFDAKGIETVRRDGHPAQQYIVEHALRSFFKDPNVTNLKEYIQTEFSKIIDSKVSLKDFCFAKEVKIGKYKNPPPGAIVSMKKMENDERSEPEYRERVPYLIMKKAGSILRERAVSPEEFIKNNYELDSEYYITKTLIPPLERIFNIIGIDVRSWYLEMPKLMKTHLVYKGNCLSCGKRLANNPTSTNGKLCLQCFKDELRCVYNISAEIKKHFIKLRNSTMVCRSHSLGSSILCESHDCEDYYIREKEKTILKELHERKKEIMEELGFEN